MPSVVNGCGTWYYGKRNMQQYPGTCSSCGRHVTLVSYDTRLYVTIVFIPVIPLNKRRIIEECGACRRHRAMPLAEYRRAELRAEETIAAFRANPTDRTLAEEVLRACAGYRNLPALLNIAPEIERHQLNEPKTLGLLSVVFETFGRVGDQERVLRLAIGENRDASDPGPEMDEPLEQELCELLATCLLNQGKPDQAEAYLSHVVDKGMPDRVDFIYHLAQGYQTKGNHEKALEYFGHCESINPNISQDETFVRLRDASSAKLGTTVAVKPNEVVKKARSAAGRRKLLKRVPAVVALGFVAYLGLGWIMGMRQQVFIVNGLSKPYSVELNGTKYDLPPNGYVPARVAQGNVKLVADGIAGAPSSVAVHTSLLTRPFASNAVVINPDRTAVIHHRTTFYGSHTSGHEPVDEFRVGEIVYAFSGIDYAFEPFPASIKVDSKSTSVVSRERVGVIEESALGMPRSYALLMLQAELGKTAVALAARQHLTLDPEADVQAYLAALERATTPAELVEFLRPGLTARPLRLQWHRAYQEAMESLGREEEVTKEYRELLEKDPQNTDLMYLTSREEPDPARGDELCERAVAGSPPCAYAAYSLAYRLMSDGDFERAAARAREAVKLASAGPTGAAAVPLEFKGRLKEALAASGHFDELLEVIDREPETSPQIVLANAAEKSYAHLRAGRKDEAWAAVSNVKLRVQRFGSPLIDAEIERLGAELSYASGEWGKFVKAMAGATMAPERMAAHLTAGDLDAAERDFAELKGPSARTHLLYYIAATHAARSELAEKHLAAAVKKLAEGRREHRAFAAALEGKSTVPPAELAKLRLEVDEKVVLLTTVGLRDPAARDVCFAMVRKLNHDRRFPYLLVQDAVGSGVAAR